MPYLARTRFLKARKAILYDAVDATEDVTDTEAAMTGSDIDGYVVTNTIFDQDSLTSTSRSTPTSSIPTSMETYLVSSDTTPEPSANPALGARQPDSPRDRAVVPVFVGSAIGTLALIGVTVFVVSCRRRRARGKSGGGIAASRHWFADEKKGTIVAIRVPQPTVPLKGILIQNPTSFPPSSSDPHLNRLSLTSSQFSVVVTNLPKSYDSGLEDGVLEEARKGDEGLQIRASRIGPSPSDFLVKLFGQADDLTPSPSQNLAPPSQSAPHSPATSPPRVVAPTAPHCNDSPLLTHAFLNSPTPTVTHNTASPSLGVVSGPRGHGLVLTGDQHVPVPSFAQWHYQKAAVRSRGEIGARFEQPF